MGFNAGGTNVTGVYVIPRGTLTIIPNDSMTTNITADGNFDANYTVPAGKIFTIVSWGGFKSSGTWTLSNRILVINDGVTSNSVTSTPGQLVQLITVPAGYIIKSRAAVTGWSVAGNYIGELTGYLADA